MRGYIGRSSNFRKRTIVNTKWKLLPGLRRTDMNGEGLKQVCAFPGNPFASDFNNIFGWIIQHRYGYEAVARKK